MPHHNLDFKPDPRLVVAVKFVVFAIGGALGGLILLGVFARYGVFHDIAPDTAKFVIVSVLLITSILGPIIGFLYIRDKNLEKNAEQ